MAPEADWRSLADLVSRWGLTGHLADRLLDVADGLAAEVVIGRVPLDGPMPARLRTALAVDRLLIRAVGLEEVAAALRRPLRRGGRSALDHIARCRAGLMLVHVDLLGRVSGRELKWRTRTRLERFMGVEDERPFGPLEPVGGKPQRRREPPRLDVVGRSLLPSTRLGAVALDGGIGGKLDSLLERLPLVGAQAMGPHPEGGISLIEGIRGSAPWFEPVLSKLQDQLTLSLRAGRNWLSWRPLCLVGPPGSGKTHLARIIAERSGAFTATLDLGGTSDARMLEGTARGWMSAQPCWPALMMAEAGQANPVLLVEELDKVERRAGGGDSYGVLLSMLEPRSAQSYYDKRLLGEVDLSHVCWILTCNSVAPLPKPLRSRLDIVEVKPPPLEHFERLLASVQLAACARRGLPARPMPHFTAAIAATLRRAYGHHRSVRTLMRHVETLLPFAPDLDDTCVH